MTPDFARAGTSAAADDVSVPMRPDTPRIGDPVAWFAALALAPIYMVVGGILARMLFGLDLWFGAAATGIAVLAWTTWFLHRRRARLPRPPALVTAEALVVTPRGWRRPITLAYADIRYLSRVPGVALTLGRDAGQIELLDEDFVAPEALDLIELAIRRAVVALPDGPARYATMQANQRLTRLLGARSVPVTWTLLGISAVMFVIELALGATHDPRVLVLLGANVPVLVRDGQWWRLVTAGFLHGNLTHIALNGMALMSVGALLEKLIGHTRLVIVALAAGIAGNLASAWFGGGAMSVGASSCVFGLLGALLALQLGKQANLPPQLIVSRRQWMFLLGVNAAISLLPGIDLFAHAGGFAAGAALGALFVPGLDIRHPRESITLRAGAALLVLTCTVAFAVALHRAQHADARHDALRALGPAARLSDEVRRHTMPGFTLDLPGWVSIGHAPGLLALSNGTSAVLASRHGAPLDTAGLAALLKNVGARVRLTQDADGGISYAGRWQGRPVHGAAMQRRCPGGAVVLLVFAPDDRTASHLLERLARAHCARPDEAPQIWPAAPAAR